MRPILIVLIILILSLIIISSYFHVNISKSGKIAFSSSIEDSKKRNIFCCDLNIDSIPKNTGINKIYVDRLFKIPSIYYDQTQIIDSSFVISIDQNSEIVTEIYNITIVDLNGNYINNHYIDKYKDVIRIIFKSDSCPHIINLEIKNKSYRLICRKN